MALDNSSLMGFAMLASMKKAERRRAETPLILTLIPGPPETRAAISTVAVGNQARDSLRREKKVASAVLGAVESIAAGQPPEAAFAGQPALRDLDPDQLSSRFIKGAPRAVANDDDVWELRRALASATKLLIEAVGRTKNQLFTEDEAKPFNGYLKTLTPEQRSKIVKGSGAET